MSIRLENCSESSIAIKLEEEIVGVIVGKDRFPKWVYRDVDIEHELDFIESIDKPLRHKHLYRIDINKNCRNKGYFKDAMKQFELLVTKQGYEAITLLSSKKLSNLYQKLGYEQLAYLDSINMYVFKKQLCSSNNVTI